MDEDLRHQIEGLQRELDDLRLILAQSTDLISRHSLQGIYTYSSPASKALLGFEPEELIGKNPYDFIHPDDINNVAQSHQAIQDQPVVYTVDYRLRHKDGNYSWFQTTSKIIADATTGEPKEIIAVTRDASERKQLEESLLRLATDDTLTGLLRPHVFYANLERAINLARRGGHKLAVLFIDLDKFKSVNDEHGHQVGDAFLQALALRVKDSLRASDLVGRLGGDEFGIILDNVADLQEARAGAERLLSAFEEPLEIGELRLPASFSVGISLFPDDADDAATLLRKADNAMYTAKGTDQRIAV